ncbi:MAG: hypothetical protein AAF203_08490, partial [Pseudomonadota bacterium]
LDEKSWIFQKRPPLFKVLEGSDEELEALAMSLPLEVWARGLVFFDRKECEKLFHFFSGKQKFMMRDFREKLGENAQINKKAIAAKKQIVSQYYKQQIELTKKKEDDHAA